MTKMNFNFWDAGRGTAAWVWANFPFLGLSSAFYYCGKIKRLIKLILFNYFFVSI